ncbi:MAG: cation-translocating P-type ATPase [candidate division WOR-3 bacterium]
MILKSEREETWHTKSPKEVLEELKTQAEGLSEEAAKERLKRFGPNRLRELRRRNLLFFFLEQFKNFLILILLFATLIAILTGDWTEGFVILAIVFLSALLGGVQNYQAERAVRELKSLLSPYTRVMREGKEKVISAEEIVPGDIILLSAGDKIPADCYLLSENTLKVDESILTGESIPVEKDVCILPPETPSFARRNILFSGTSVVYGKGKAVVFATGMDTEFGKIAQVLEKIEEKKTPLQISLDKLGRWFGILTLLISGLIFLIGFYRGESLTKMFLWAIALAVAVVPEALPAVITVSLSLGVKRMAERKGLVQKLASVETLGAVNVICSDKTGTLTKGEMAVKEIFLPPNVLVEVSGVGYEPKGEFFLKAGSHPNLEEALDSLLRVGFLCNDASLRREGEKWVIDGDPTEGALLVLAEKRGLKREDLLREWPRVDEIPFTPERKLMTTVHKKEDLSFIASKGAGEVVLERCRLEEGVRQQYLSILKEMAERGLRVLGLAFKEGEILSDEGIEEDLTFLGFVGMMDLPRPEVKPAVDKCRDAGIKPVMITGDHLLTAQAVAKEIGIAQRDGISLTGADLDRMSDEELTEKVEKIDLIARVSPFHKLRIVSAFQSKGYVVAMTGDGVNDAPALKKADIGIAMGITGTQVAKEVSDLVILDDNFATIVQSVEEGRNIFKNTKNFLSYGLTLHLAEILIILFTLLFGLPLPLTAVQILFLNLVTDGLPPLALSLEAPEPDLMRQPPRGRKELFFTKRNVGFSLILAILLTIQALFIFFNHRSDINQARTLVLSLLTISAMFNCGNWRSERFSLFKIGLFSNPQLLFAQSLTFLSLLAILYFPPLAKLFEIAPFPFSRWLIIIPLSATTLLLGELLKRLKW